MVRFSWVERLDIEAVFLRLEVTPLQGAFNGLKGPGDGNAYREGDRASWGDSVAGTQSETEGRSSGRGGLQSLT